MLSSAVGLVFSIIYLLLVKTFTKIILEVTLALSVLLNIGYCVYLWIEGFTSAAIIFTIFAVFSIIAYFFMRKRIPFAKVMLQTIIRAANEYKSVYVVALLGLIVQTAFSVWFAWTLVAVYQRFEPNTTASGSSSSSGAVIGLVVFCIVSFRFQILVCFSCSWYWSSFLRSLWQFAYYYISEVIKNVAFATVAGVFGTWYYSQNRPAHAALSSFKRAMTYSFGSICFGSLIVALLDLIRAILSIIQQQEAAEGDIVSSILACVAGCCVGCINSLVQYFSEYMITLPVPLFSSVFRLLRFLGRSLVLFSFAPHSHRSLRIYQHQSLRKQLHYSCQRDLATPQAQRNRCSHQWFSRQYLLDNRKLCRGNSLRSVFLHLSQEDRSGIHWSKWRLLFRHPSLLIRARI